MKILLLHDAYFLNALRNLGHTVFFAGADAHADLQVECKPVMLTSILKKCPFKPDFVLLSDSVDVRGAIQDLEKVVIPKVFYGLDSPLNAYWQSDYVRAFDVAFLDQKGPADALRRVCDGEFDGKNRVFWLPPGTDHRQYRNLSLEKVYDIALTGSLDSSSQAKRVWLIEELRHHFDLAIFDNQGQSSLSGPEIAQIYNQSRLVLSDNPYPGIYQRVFEAMASGACLLTEESNGSWKKFFRDWEHLVSFRPENLIERVGALLDNSNLRQRIAQKGTRLVRRRHTIESRARKLLMKVTEVLAGSQIQRAVGNKYFHLGKAYLSMAERWPRHPVGGLRKDGVRLLFTESQTHRESAALHFELGAEALAQKQHREAFGSFRRALQLDPAHLRSHWGMFWCYRETAAHAGAVSEIITFHRYLQGAREDPGFLERMRNGEDLTAGDYFYFGNLLGRAGCLIEVGINRSAGHTCRWNALDCYRKAMAFDPAMAAAYLRCADVLEEHQYPEAAVGLVERVVKLNPNDGEVRLRFVDLLLRCYRRQEGLRQLVQFLFTSDDPGKWERVENLLLSDSEWNDLLLAVRNVSKRSELAAKVALSRSRVLVRTNDSTQLAEKVAP